MNDERPGSPLGCQRVLVVEDNPIHQVVVAAMLRKLGLQCDTVETGEAAVQAWSAGQYDIILMDVHLAGMDGMSATREIRQREATEGHVRKTPIVAMTSYITDQEIALYRECGMTGYIGKPLDEPRVLKALETWCEGRAGPRAA